MIKETQYVAFWRCVLLCFMIVIMMKVSKSPVLNRNACLQLRGRAGRAPERDAGPEEEADPGVPDRGERVLQRG